MNLIIAIATSYPLLLLCLLSASASHSSSAAQTFHLHLEQRCLSKDDHRCHPPSFAVSFLHQVVSSLTSFTTDEEQENKQAADLQCFDESTCLARQNTAHVNYTVLLNSLSRDPNHLDLFITASSVESESHLALESLIHVVEILGQVNPQEGNETSYTTTATESVTTSNNSSTSTSYTTITTWTIDRHPSSSSPSKTKSLWEREISLDSMVLSNPNSYYKKRLVTSSKDRLDHPILSLWEYSNDSTYYTKGVNKEKTPEDEDHERSLTTTRSMFVNSQLRATSDASMQAFAETFVHPSLISHPNPRIVALFSDAPLVALKELLRYKSIQKVYLLGMNERLVEMIAMYFPELNDCSQMSVPNRSSCMTNDRIEIVAEANVEEWSESLDLEVDVVLVDAAMSHQKSSWLKFDFYESISDFLEDENGIIVVNVGSPPTIGVKTAFGTDDPDRDDFFSSSQDFRVFGFSVVYAYDETSVQPFPSAFALIFSDDTSLSFKRFLRTSPAAFDLDMIERFYSFNTPLPTLLYDGPTHLTYKYPSRAWENWYCQSKVGKEMVVCQSFLQRFYDSVNHETHITTVRRDPEKGRGLYAVQDIREGTWINSDDTALQLAIDGTLWSALLEFIEKYPDATMYKGLRDWMIAYGFENESTGNTGWSASIANINTFTNHACDKLSANVGIVNFGYATFDLGNNRRNYLDLITEAKRDIVAGEEVQMDYSVFRTELDDGAIPEEFQRFLDSICLTKKGLVDVVSQYEVQNEKEL